jgi:dUTP pyrophosphatase
MATKRQTTKKNDVPNLGVYKLYSDTPDLKLATDGSACFDISAYLPAGELVSIYNSSNKPKSIISKYISSQQNEGVVLDPGDRALIPTGFVFDIPDGYSIRIHPRSGLSWKSGLSLANAEGVVDSDYVFEVYISLVNTSNVRVVVKHQDRIAQLELVKNQKFNVVSLSKKPTQKTKRSGGFGHTGE